MTHEIVVVGAGSNSLTTACYLAKGGLSVLVLEREEQCGGGIIHGEIMGAMPVRAVLTPDQARAALKLLNFRSVLFLLTLLFRSGAPGRSQPNYPR